ncbi:MAG: YegP family protein [Lachnospiraceae bacterium]
MPIKNHFFCFLFCCIALLFRQALPRQNSCLFYLLLYNIFIKIQRRLHWVNLSNKNKHRRFRLKASNGQIIAVSEGCKAMAGCMNGIESVKKNAVDAPTVEE